MNVHNDLVNPRRAQLRSVAEPWRTTEVLERPPRLIGVLASGRMSSIVPFSDTLGSGWTRIATGQLVLGFIVMPRAITLGRDRRA